MKNNSFTNKPLGADISVSTQTVRPTFIHPKPKKLSPLEVFINQSILFDHLHGYVRSFATVTFFSTLLVSVLSFASSVHELNRLRGAPEWAEFNLRCQGTDGLFSIEMTSATDNDSLRAQLDSFGSVDTLIPPTPLILMRITEIIGERSESMTIALPAELRHGRLDIFSEQVADQVVNNQRDKALTGSTGRQFNFGHDFEHSKGRHVRAGYNRKILLSLDLESGLGSAWPQGLNAKIICTKGENYLLKDLLFGGPSLYDKNPQALPILRETLQPLDLILTRNSELTSRLLPGYFSHAAVVIGSPEQLKQLGLWSHPAIASLHDKFKSEPLIIESIIPKVRVVSLLDFLNRNEEILVVRKKGLASQPGLIGTSLDIGTQQLEKPYDLLLDLESEDRIFCAELPKMMFEYVRWPTRFGFGITSIMPDNLAGIVFHRESRFEFVSYMNGDVVSDASQVDVHKVASKISFEYLDENAEPVPRDSLRPGYDWSYEKQLLGIEFVEKYPAEKVVERWSLFFKHIYRLYRYHEKNTEVPLQGESGRAI